MMFLVSISHAGASTTAVAASLQQALAAVFPTAAVQVVDAGIEEVRPVLLGDPDRCDLCDRAAATHDGCCSDCMALGV